MIGDHFTVSEKFLDELVDLGLGIQDIEDALLRRMNSDLRETGHINKIPAKEAFDVFFSNVNKIGTVHKHLSETSIKTYRTVLERFYRFSTRTSERPLELEDLLTTALPFLAYCADNADPKLGTSTLNKYIAIMRSFIHEICFQYHIKEPRLPRYYPRNEDLPQALSDDEVRELLAICQRGQYGIRNLLLVSFLLCTGLRRDEFRKIKMADIDMESSTVKVVGKGTKPRVVFLPSVLRNALSEYCSVYEIGRPEHYLYPNLQNPSAPVASSTLDDTAQRLFQKMSRYSKTDRSHHYHLHSLRHTYAVSLLRSGVPLRTIAQVLGHRSVRSTQIYTVLDVEQLRKQLSGGLIVLSKWWGENND